MRFSAFNFNYGIILSEIREKITISGFVVDVTATPVADAIILIDGEKTGKITDSKGFYKIKVRPENKKIGVCTSSGGIIEEVINGRKILILPLKSQFRTRKLIRKMNQLISVTEK